MIKPRKLKPVTCRTCGSTFAEDDLEKTCSNCFACSGCEIYICPSCNNEIVLKPIKPMARKNSIDNSQF